MDMSKLNLSIKEIFDIIHYLWMAYGTIETMPTDNEEELSRIHELIIKLQEIKV